MQSSHSLELKTKALFVGLGGTGKRALVQLKRKFHLVGINTAANTVESARINLLCIDFDDALVDVAVDEEEAVKLDIGEYLYLPTQEVENRIRNIGDERSAHYFESWYPDMEGKTIRFGVASSGAAQWRPLGRIGYYEHAETIHPKLRKKYAELMRTHSADKGIMRNEPVVIYVISSISGGTGAGILIDTLYYLRGLAKNAPIFAMLVLPDVYKEWDQHGRLYANSYATLKELSSFIPQTHPFRARYPDDEDIDVRKGQKPPVDLVFLFDELVGETTWATADQLVEYVAESMFVDVYASALEDEQASYLTNLTSYAGKFKFDPLSARCLFNVTGSSSVILPSQQETKDYLAARFSLAKLLPIIDAGITNIDKMDADGVVAALDETDRERVEVTLDETLRYVSDVQTEMETLLVRWSAARMGDMANSMYESFGQARGNFEHCKQIIDDWTEAFLCLSKIKGMDKYPTAPFNLPGEKSNTFQDHIKNFNLRIRENIAELQEQAPGTLQRRRVNVAIYTTFKALAERLRSEYQAEQIEQQKEFNRRGSRYERVVGELSRVIASKPWERFMRLQELSYKSVLNRLFEVLSRPYQKVIRKVHINHYLADKIEEAIRELVERDKLKLIEAQEVIDQVKEDVQMRREAIEERMVAYERQSSLTESYVDHKQYFGALWEAVVDEVEGREEEKKTILFDQDSLFQDFETFALERARRQGEEEEDERFDILSRDNAEAATESFLDFALETIIDRVSADQLNPLNVLLNGPLFDEFAAYLEKARNEHFVTSDVSNPNDARDVFVSVPTFGRHPKESGPLIEKLEHLLDHVFGSPKIHRVFDRRPGSNRLVVKYVSLNHPTDNLKNMGNMYRQYMSYGEYRKMFHLDGQYADALPEVYIEFEDEAERVVLCGNDGCEHDITEAPRTLILCPGCGQPIRTRCGNEHCTADDLHKDTSLQDNPERRCPSCEQKLRTYWWWCPDHKEYFRTDSRHCSVCIDEFNRGVRIFADVTSVDGIPKTYKCPGCQHEERPDPTRFQFRDIYYEVSPEDVRRANTVFAGKHADKDKSESIIHGVCEQCSSTLLPICPHLDEDERESNPHYVSRNREGLLICTHNQEHARRHIYECAICAFPLREEDNYCRRCQTRLDPDAVEGRIKYPENWPRPGKDETEHAYYSRLKAWLDGQRLYDEWVDAQRMRQALRQRIGATDGAPTNGVAAAMHGGVAEASPPSADDGGAPDSISEALFQVARKLGLEEEE